MPAFCSLCKKSFLGPIVPESHVAGAAHRRLLAAAPSTPKAAVPKAAEGEMFAFTIDAPVGSVTPQHGRELLNESNLPAVALAAARFATSRLISVSLECEASGSPNASGHLLARLVADVHDESSSSDFQLATEKLSIPAASSASFSKKYSGLEGTTSVFPSKLRSGLPGLAIDWLSTASVPLTLVVRLVLVGSGRNDILDAKKGMEVDEPLVTNPTKDGYLEGVDNIYVLVIKQDLEVKSTANGIEHKGSGGWQVRTNAPPPAEAFHIEVKGAATIAYIV